MKPLVVLLDELAAVQPEARFAILELGWEVPGWHPGSIILSVEDLARYFRLAIDDPRLKPRARARLIGPNFYWERDDDGIGTVMGYDPKLRISMPFMREET